MVKADYEKVLDVLERELAMELKCAEKCKEMMRKTLNPIKRYSLKRGAECSIHHVVGIKLAIYQFKKNFGPIQED